MHSLLGEPTGQGWIQLFELATALVLSALIGLERELRQKSLADHRRGYGGRRGPAGARGGDDGRLLRRCLRVHPALGLPASAG